MIKFDNNNKVFSLTNDYVSYIIRISDNGILQHVYFGTKVSDVDLLPLDFDSEWSHVYLDKEDNTEKVFSDSYYYDRSLTEVASHGVGDKRGAPIIIKQEDGLNYTDFRFESYSIYDGKPQLTELPCTHADACKTLEIVLKDVRKNVKLLLSYTILKDFCGIIRNSTVINHCEKPIFIKRAYSLQLDIPHSNFNVWHFSGDWTHEMVRNLTPISNGLFRVCSNHGRSSHEANNFVMLAQKDATESYGEVYGFSFLYSGNFSTDVFVDKWKATRVMQGINEEDFEFAVNPQQRFAFPEAFVCYSDSGLGNMSRAMHDFVRTHVIPQRFCGSQQKILLNSWEGCYFDFNTEKIVNLLDRAKQWGVELFCLDDGWFINRNDDTNGLGDWQIDTKKIDLEKIINCCKKNGIVFGLWFEPEMISMGSELYKEHPEFCLGVPRTDNTMWRHQLALDMANDEVVYCIYDKMSAILEKYDIGYVKWDNNKTLTNMYSPSCKNQGEAYHKNMLGTYKLMSMLTKRFPNVLFEGCASGGGRFDYGILSYFPQIQGSDEMDPLVRIFMQYSYSYGYPFDVVGYHVNINPIMSFKSKASLALWGTYGLELDPLKYGESEQNEIAEINALYHNYHREVIEQGDLYRIYSPYDSNYMCMASVSKDKSKAMAIFVNVLKESPRFRFIKIEGLDDNASYVNSYDNTVHSGAYYKNVGLNLCRSLTEFECILITIDQV